MANKRYGIKVYYWDSEKKQERSLRFWGDCREEAEERQCWFEERNPHMTFLSVQIVNRQT